MKALKLSILAAVIVCGISTVKAQTADEIMEKHQKAIGSVEAWNNIKTVKMEGTMSIQGNDINITQTMALGKAMRTDLNAMGMNFYQIVTKTKGWMYMPGMEKVDTMKPEMLKAFQAQLELKGKELLSYKENGTKAEYLGKDTLNKVVCYKLKFTDKDGNESTSFFDATTYYLMRTESKVKQKDEEEQEVAIGYDNYKKMDEGVVMPMTITPMGNEINFKSIELNKPVDDKIFMPGDATTESGAAAK